MAVAVGTFDRPILAVDLKFGLLIAADVTASFFSFGLSVCTVAGALDTISLDLPAAVLVWHHSVGISCHLTLLGIQPQTLEDAAS